MILSSTDGVTWTERFTGSDVLFGITYGNGRFVAVGGNNSEDSCSQGIILSSEDGAVWTVRYRGADFYSVTFGNGVFVAVGPYGAIATSGNGDSWTAQQNVTEQWLFATAHGNGTFIAVGGDNGVILSSSDGIDWIERYTSSSVHFAAATFGDGTFLAAGYDGHMFTSRDGIHWVQRDSGSGNSFSDTAFGNNTFVAVGSDGTILQSAPIVRLGIEFAGLPVLTISGPAGWYRTESVEVLNPTNAWNALTTLSVTNGPQVWTDLQATEFRQRFYRAVLLP